MFMGIDRDAWISLWAGALGAVPAAVMSAAVAAWVAVTVLNRSNAHQRLIAADAATEQARLSKMQLEEQKRLSEAQLAEQRDEAERVRRNQVMADLLGSANGFGVAAAVSPDAVDAQRVQFATHTYRWEMEIDDRNSNLELLAWANILWKPARYLAQLNEAPAETRSAWTRFLGEVETAFTSSGIVLSSADSPGRTEFLGFMKETRGNLENRWRDELSNMPGAPFTVASGSSSN
ncbi:hypothetical protein LJ753_11065 [Arthrobacter sp. zg-Y20]|uniref:hypothetical protein n=1 Tax=unclassified Arthrobacter TaxID=235627 RepID=UPI001D152390|nr:MULTISPECIES: hypothetical protein [unclassified Arthrobacter]MCC3276410.1 hypothetical protein [Arthrobacter sp. zg-Y20]MDK1316569.1 hypothetical protein [Arthrobacter sp. zg.Y20]WIB06609.1 hypothetical protein QNO06_02365 [Arthrobacter sp. zg-Y20]